MPTYDYECLACKHRFELFQKMTDEPVKKCPCCNKNKAKRLIGSGMGIIFKGSGFYETDYKRKVDPNQQRETAKKRDLKPEGEAASKTKTDKSTDLTQNKKAESTSKNSGKEKDKK